MIQVLQQLMQRTSTTVPAMYAELLLLQLDITSFDCSNTGANTVTLTVTDNNENVCCM